MAPNWKHLASLTADDLQIALLAEVDAIMEGHLGPEEDRLLLTLPEPLRAVWIMNWLDFEVCLGSLLAYFYNDAGRYSGRDAQLTGCARELTSAAPSGAPGGVQEGRVLGRDVRSEHRVQVHRRRVLAGRNLAAQRLGHGPDVMRAGAAADAHVVRAELTGLQREVRHLETRAAESVERDWEGPLPVR
jgi:hypothetical protein